MLDSTKCILKNYCLNMQCLVSEKRVITNYIVKQLIIALKINTCNYKQSQSYNIIITSILPLFTVKQNKTDSCYFLSSKYLC